MFQAVLEAEPGSAFSRAPHRYVSAHALARARAGHPLGEGEAPLVADAFSCPLLVIDDLGSEDARFGTVVSEVIYERHARNRKTWITTGVRPADIAQRYGGGIVRRVLEWADRFDLQRGGAS
ncbi:MAG: hypothetical protein FWD73_06990 [Polyangiaceae bacterium]|nr:hypothetical protein [Polyangiaceae bacterium]